ncbi:Nramp family divalent metal transporter [Sabulilitoribacter arenilitoris]|uniref:Nramp family divalent metal transporter n=1 Tax=Wocania arenilitoris TaxID=2044858 RepID=A0AAE3ESQ3_9FLAO|nr:Nramp family divalent metal transporter [Wocania arenilitoris]MCF7569599.1 Nramp family divalent metal transporter [Wocania arenilitoris]
MSKFKKLIASILPGIFLIGYNVGTGSVTSMSKAGANFGLDLLWTVLISCLITYYLIVLFSKYTMVTGDTIIQGIKKYIHPSIAIILITALSIIILSALMGLVGILADVLQVWSTSILDLGISSLFWAISIATSIYILLWVGNYAFFEKVLAVFVAIMGTAFIATMFINFPSVDELARGLVPTLPETAEGSDNSPLIIIAGMVGTTVSVFTFIIRSQIVKEIGWKIKDTKLQKRDAFISASMMFIISAAVMITAASTLHVQGLTMNNVAEMVPLLEPIAGKAALGVFVIGIVAAGLSSHLPNLLVIPWLIIDYKNEERNTQTKKYRIILFVLSVVSIFGVAFGFKPVFVLMLSQACIAIILPITIACIFYLTSKKALMSSNVNRIYDFIILSVILVFSIYVSSLGIEGLIADLATFLI